MINPLRSEQDAFRFTLIVLALLAPIAIVAVVFSTGAGLAVAGGLAIGLVVGLFVLKRDEPPEKMLLGRRPESADGVHRILVVANETLSGRALREEISQRGHGGQSKLMVVCPALNSKVRHWTNEEDAARAAAGRRLEALLSGLRAEGFDVDGDIGDDDPVQAMEDALRRFPADEVIISTHPPGRSNWLERDVVERARRRSDVDVAHVVVDLDREAAVARPATEP
jgi:GABA permease